ncbi:MAG: polysaccharide biosynthesis C-terminal domain-containing protein [Nitrospira sp.]|nr:polysaccharide biosynthesis C-terminal domain-containing protein [Nitrospira sp.]
MLTASTLGPWWVSLKSSAKEMGLLGRIPIYSVASGIVILAGLVREVVVASTFGLSGDLDVLVAVMGFHLLFGVQVGNAIEHVFVSKTAAQHGGSIRPLIKRASLVLLAINVVALTVLVFGSRSVLQAIFPQFTVDQCDTGVRLIRLLLFPIACAGLAGLMRGGLSVTGSFAPIFLSGAVVSLSTIVSVLVFADHWGIDAMVWGFATGHFLVLVWFAIVLSRSPVPPPVTNAQDQRVRVRELWRPVLIVLIGEFLFQAVVMTERSFASGLGTGKIAAFFYAGSVVAAPLALFTTPVNTTLFPKLVRAFHAGYHEGRQVLARYGAMLFGVTFLFSVLLALVSEPLIEAALARGKFTTADARLTAHILSMLVWGLPFASLYGVIRNSFYSLSDYRTPLLGYGIKWVTLLLCGSWLIPLLGVDGLAVASVAAQATDTGVMGWLLRRRLADLSEGV